MKTMKIAIVSDDEPMRKSIENCFYSHPDISIVFSSGDGYDCIEELKHSNADIVITQVLMSGLSGLDLMEQFSEEGHIPKFIIISDFKNEAFMYKYLSAGASAYMSKPLNMKHLENKVYDLANKHKHKLQTKPPHPTTTYRGIDERLSTIFVSIGIPPHIKGYQFLRDGIKCVVDDPAIINSITQGLYPTIAKRFETSASKVERAIRHAIEVAWSRGKIENINNLFGVKVYSSNDKPTNGEFIALLADKMLLEGA